MNFVTTFGTCKIVPRPRNPPRGGHLTVDILSCQRKFVKWPKVSINPIWWISTYMVGLSPIVPNTCGVIWLKILWFTLNKYQTIRKFFLRFALIFSSLMRQDVFEVLFYTFDCLFCPVLSRFQLSDGSNRNRRRSKWQSGCAKILSRWL